MMEAQPSNPAFAQHRASPTSEKAFPDVIPQTTMTGCSLSRASLSSPVSVRKHHRDRSVGRHGRSAGFGSLDVSQYNGGSVGPVAVHKELLNLLTAQWLAAWDSMRVQCHAMEYHGRKEDFLEDLPFCSI